MYYICKYLYKVVEFPSDLVEARLSRGSEWWMGLGMNWNQHESLPAEELHVFCQSRHSFSIFRADSGEGC